MAIISLEVSDEDLKLFKDYAERNNETLSEMIRNTIIERIEDEYDLRAFEEYEADKKAGRLKLRPIQELWEELDL